MKNKVILIISVLLFLVIYIFACLNKYPQVEIDKEKLYLDHTEKLKDFVMMDSELKATTNDPWIDYSLDESVPIRAFALDVSAIDSLGGMCEIFETENWKSVRHSLKLGRNYIFLYNSSVGTWYEKDLRFDLVEVENATIQIDKIVINPNYAIVCYSIIWYLCALIVVVFIYCMIKKIYKSAIFIFNDISVSILLQKLFYVVISFCAAAYVAHFMRLPENGVLWIAISVLLFLLMNQKEIYSNKFQAGVFLFFSALLSIANVMGAHIVTNGNFYFGLLTENYITPYTINDLFGFFVLTYVFWKLLGYGYKRLSVIINKINLNDRYFKVNSKYCILVALIIFISWIPYFLVYYPGFIFPDSLSSIYQALGAPLNNHHPIMYTLFIKLCLKFGMILKDITFGCAIYTILQMAYIAFSLAYMICWIKYRGVSSRICIFMMISFGFLPFIAQNSIAMWKDPIFSATILLWSMHLLDYALYGGGITDKDKLYIMKSCILTFLICFSRNNGFYIVLVCESIFIMLLVVKRKMHEIVLKKLCISTGVVLLIVYFITGPIYSHFGLKEEKVESLGIFLNQMARVAAYDGDMSEQDKEFMDNLLPIEMYAETYRPCVVDRLKWDENFHADYLNGHAKDFMRAYFSMLIKNPGYYIEAWELNTFGYWAPNYWEFFNDEDNITKGDLPSFYTWDHKGITPRNLLGNIPIDWNGVFKNQGKAFYLAIINWLIFFVVVVVVVNKKWSYLLVVAPSLGLIATLLIATPYVYWQRYGLAEYYLLPVYFYVLYAALKYNANESCNK